MPDLMHQLHNLGDTERSADRVGKRTRSSVLPWLADKLLVNGLELANAYQVPRDLMASLARAVYDAPGAIAGAAQAHLTGEVPLPTGEPGRPFTTADAYRGGALATNALGSAGLMAGPIAGRAMQGVAATAKPAAGITAYHGSPQAWQGNRFNPDIAKQKLNSGGGDFNLSSSPSVASGYAGDFDGAVVYPAKVNFRNPYVHKSQLELEQAEMEILQERASAAGHDGLVVRIHHPKYYPQGQDEYVPLKHGTVKSSTTGQTLFSDNRGAAPIGSFAALPSAEVKSSPDAMFRPERARKIQEDGLPEHRTIDTYHGTSDVEGVMREGLQPGRGWAGGVHTTTDPEFADVFAADMLDGQRAGVIPTQNRGRYVDADADPELARLYQVKNDYGIVSPNNRRMKDLEAAGVDGVVFDGGRDVATFNQARGTVYDRAGNKLFSDNRGAAPAAGITAYHGSPHDFDRFSMDKIGTGEGQQAYGHGLYFAESRNVAKAYQDMLGDSPDRVRVFVGGKEIAKPATAAESGALNVVKLHGANADVEKFALQLVGPEGRDVIREWKKQGLTSTEPPKGRLYEVNIKASKDDFLDLDNLHNVDVADLPKQQVAALKGAGVINDSNVVALDARLSLGDPATVNKLREAGIPGIKYLDQGSRGSGQGTYNYVVFDENLIEISKKMGIAVPMPGMPGAVSIPGDQMERLQAAQQVLEQETEPFRRRTSLMEGLR